MDIHFVKMSLSIALGTGSLALFYFSIKKAKRGQFYTDTFWLIPLGIYVWGDGLIMAPFWILASVLFLFLEPINCLRFILLFLTIRAAYETIYWLVHQSSNRSFNPPLFRRVDWLKAADSAILYQLMNMIWVIVFSFGLLLTFAG